MRSRKLLIGLAAVGVLFVGLAAPAAAQSLRDIPEIGDSFCDGAQEQAEQDPTGVFPQIFDEACGPADEDPPEDDAPDEDDGDDRAAQCALIDPIVEGFAEFGAPEELVGLLQTIADTLDCPAADDEPAPADPPPPPPAEDPPPPESAPVLPRTGGALMGIAALGLAGFGGLGLAIRRFLV